MAQLRQPPIRITLNSGSGSAARNSVSARERPKRLRNGSPSGKGVKGAKGVDLERFVLGVKVSGRRLKAAAERFVLGVKVKGVGLRRPRNGSPSALRLRASA